MRTRQRIRGSRAYVAQSSRASGRSGSVRGAGLPARLGEIAGRSTTHVVCAVLVMGGWAAFANRAHGASAALTAGLVQGAASALVTFTLKTALDAMSGRLEDVLAFVLPPTVSCCVVITLLVTAHRLAGTRELWSTIAIPYVASSAYAWIYTAVLVGRRSDTRSRE